MVHVFNLMKYQYTTYLPEGIRGKFIKRPMVEVEVKIEHLDSSMIPVGFIDSPHVGALLGQEGFFDGHRIKFEKDHNIFEVSRVSN